VSQYRTRPSRNGTVVEFPVRIHADITDARILVVGHGFALRRTIAEHLREAGFVNLVEVRDGVEALAAVRACRPELVITDLILANMDGFELCRQLRSDAATREIPILVETGLASDDRAKVFAAGATDLIIKPINSGELLGRVRVHLERRRLIERLSEFQRDMRQELDQARAMQESLLPTDDDMRRLEQRYPIALASHYAASNGLGGDMWGITVIDDSRLKVFSVDFSGHGVGAALNTFRLHSFMVSGPRQADDAGRWLEQLNRFLCGVLPVGQFATMFCGIVDFRAATLQYASAATPSHLVLSAGSDQGFQLIDGTGFPLGVRREATYQNYVLPFAPGSKLFLYSDALVETPDLENPVFTARKLSAFLDQRRGETRLERVHNAVLDQLRAACPASPIDDLTLVSLCHLETAG